MCISMSMRGKARDLELVGYIVFFMNNTDISLISAPV